MLSVFRVVKYTRYIYISFSYSHFAGLSESVSERLEIFCDPILLHVDFFSSHLIVNRSLIMPQSALLFAMLFLSALSIIHAATFASESHSNSTPYSPVTVIPTSSRFMPSHVSTADRLEDAKNPSLMAVTTDIPRPSAGSTPVSKSFDGKAHPGTVNYIPASTNPALMSGEVISTTAFIPRSSEASSSTPMITTTVKDSVTTDGPMANPTGPSEMDHKNPNIMLSTTYAPQPSSVSTSFPKATMMAHPVIPSTVMSTSTSPTQLTTIKSSSIPSTPSIRAKRSERQHQRIFRMKRSRPRKTTESLMEALLAAHDQAIENENWSNNRDRSPVIDRSQTADYLDDLPFDSYPQASQNADLTMGDPDNDDADIPLQDGHLPPSPLIFYPILGSSKINPSSSSSSSSSYSPPALGHRWPLRSSSLIRDNGNLNVDGFGDIMPIERRKRDFKYISKPFNIRPNVDQVFLKKLAELLAERKTHSNRVNTNSFNHFNDGQTVRTGYRPAWLDR